MKVTLVQSEIEEALEDYVLNKIRYSDKYEISIELKATRGEDGFQAELNITEGDEKPAVIPEKVVEKTSLFTTQTPVVKEENIFSSTVDGTPLQIENSITAEANAAEVASTEATAQTVEDQTPPQSAEPVQTTSPVTEGAPTSIPKSNSLFAHLSEPHRQGE